MPLLLSQLQLKADNVRDMETDRLQGKVLRLALEYFDASAMRYQCCGRRDLIPSKLPHVYSPHDLHLLKYNKVQIPL